MANKYFTKYNLHSEDYNLFYENKQMDKYTKLYENISEDKIQNCFTNGTENHNNFFVSTENFEKTDMNINKKIIYNNPLSVYPNLKADDIKIEIEIKVIKKCCCTRFKRKMYYCCNTFDIYLNKKCYRILEKLFSIIFLALVLFLIIASFIF